MGGKLVSPHKFVQKMFFMSLVVSFKCLKNLLITSSLFYFHSLIKSKRKLDL